MIITKKAHAAADGPARPRRDAGAAAARQHGAGARRAADTAAAAGHAPRRRLRAERHDHGAAGRRRPRAPASSSRRSCSRSSRSAISCCVVSGLDNRPAADAGDGAGDHARAGDRFLTGVPSEDDRRRRHPRPASRWIRSRRSELGQRHAAGVARARARIDATSPARCDVGLQLRLHQHASPGATPTTPLPMENNPRAVFERLFGDSGSTDPAARLARIADGPQHPRLGDRQGRATCSARLGAARPRQARPSTSRRSATSSGGSRRPRSRARRELPVVEQPAGVPATLRGARQADVRPAGARLPDRPDPRHHVHDRPRDQRPHLSRRSACPMRTTRCRITRTIREKLAKLTKINTYHIDAVRLLPRASCARRPTATARCSIT